MKPGDVVALASGGPCMTVLMEDPGRNGWWLCAFVSYSGEAQTLPYPAAALVGDSARGDLRAELDGMHDDINALFADVKALQSAKKGKP